MKPIVVASVGAIFIILAACSGDDEPLELTPPTDAQALLNESLATMEELGSYRVVMTSPAPPGDARREFRWETEFTAPDSYRFLLFGAEGEIEQVCQTYALPEGGSGETCYDVLTSISRRTLYEAITVSQKAYSRQCEDEGQECDPWQQGPRPALAIAGPSPSFLPGWPLVALEIAQNLQVVGIEEYDGVQGNPPARRRQPPAGHPRKREESPHRRRHHLLRRGVRGGSRWEGDMPRADL